MKRKEKMRVYTITVISQYMSWKRFIPTAG